MFLMIHDGQTANLLLSSFSERSRAWLSTRQRHADDKRGASIESLEVLEGPRCKVPQDRIS